MENNNINLDALVIRIGNSTSIQLKKDLLRNAFSAKQIPYVEAWIKRLEEEEKNAPVTLYHHRKAPSGETFKTYEVPTLKKGWVDSPEKFRKNIIIRTISKVKSLILNNSYPAQDKISASAKNWYEKPIGLIIIGVSIIVIGAFVVFGIKYFFPNFKL